eukprot:515002_1
MISHPKVAMSSLIKQLIWFLFVAAALMYIVLYYNGLTYYYNVNLSTNIQLIQGNITTSGNYSNIYTASISKNNLNERIPYIIWQTAPNHNIENNSILIEQIDEYKSKGFDYILMDDNELKQLFTDPTITNVNEYKIFGGNITKAFLMINPLNGAALSDYWRYYVLWKFGGIYIDLDTKCYFSKTKIQNILHNYSKYRQNTNVPFAIISMENYTFEYGENKGKFKMVQYAMISSKYHPFLQQILKKITNKILTRNIPTVKNELKQYKSNYVTVNHERTVRTTGPDIWTDAVFEVINNSNKSYEYFIDGTDYNISFQCENSFNNQVINPLYKNLSSNYSSLLDDKIEIIVTLTTIPERIISDTFKKVLLRMILNQTVKPYKILLNIPMVYARTNETYIIPDWIYDYMDIIEVNRCEKDMGPVTKLLGGLHKIKDNSLIIVGDDDIIYIDTWIENLVNDYNKYKNIKNNGNILVHYMDKPYGYSGYLLPKNTIKNIMSFRKPNSCYFVDDDYLMWCYNQLNIEFIQCDKQFWDIVETAKHPEWYELCKKTLRKELQKQCMNDLMHVK